jgi:hypothetical protein
MGWMAGGQFLVGAGIFLTTTSRPALESTQPPIQWVLVTLSPGIKQPGHETDHPPSSAAKVKNACSYTFTAPCLHKHRDNFTLPLCLLITRVPKLIVVTSNSSLLCQLFNILLMANTIHGCYYWQSLIQTLPLQFADK